MIKLNLKILIFTVGIVLALVNINKKYGKYKEVLNNRKILIESKKILKRLEQKKELIERTVDVHQLSLFGGNLEFESDLEEFENETANDLENAENNQFYEEKLAQIKEEKENLQEIVNKIENYDINNITPMDAMKFLFELKENMKNGN